ncbi:MAG: IS21 family transposase [Microbacteriaceae bacterium]
MKERSRVEQFEGIRRGYRDQDMSIRELAREHGVHRRTVRAALGDAVPPARKVPRRAAPVTGAYVEVVRAWLVADLLAPRKQRHTARRVWQRLIEEEGAVIAESTVRNLVAGLRVEITAGHTKVAIVQEHPPALEAEVDFGEFQGVIAGVVMRLWMFCLRMSHSGKAVHFAYANQSQESFLDGHVRAFEALGGVPVRMIRYDNLKPAVIRCALGRERFEHPRFVALRSHYGFDSFYCIPGIEGAHEKGGVEGEIGRFRRRHLTPVPHVGSLAALNEALAAADARDDDRRITGRVETVGAGFAAEASLLHPLPPRRFDAAARFSARVDAKARICVRQCYYSVPARYAGRRVNVRLAARTLEAYEGHKLVAQHVRALHKGTQVLVLDHYLEVLTRKPGALAGSSVLATARASGAFTPVHEAYWKGARARLGDGPGTRALIELLLLHRTLPTPAVLAAMTEAVTAATFNADVVAVTARAYQARHLDPPAPVPLPLTAPPAAHTHRATPSLTGYDQLLTTGAGA